MAIGGTFGTRVIIDPARLAEFIRSPQGPVYQRMIFDAEIVRQGARRRAPVWKPAPGEPSWSVERRTSNRRPGTLRDSIVKRITEDQGQPAVLIGSLDPVALYVHEGTVPHRIAGNPTLVFWSAKRGQVVRTHAVNHPGTKPNRFLVQALADSPDRMVYRPRLGGGFFGGAVA